MHYIPGVYFSTDIPVYIDNDIRAEEVGKILTSFPKESYARVYENMIDIITLNTVLYRMTLKTPNSNFPDIFIDVELYLNNIANNISNKLINCPWVEQNYFYLINNFHKGELLAKEDDSRANEAFEELVNMGSSAGMSFYKLNSLNLDKTFKIPIFCGFPNINKQDKVSIEVYQNLDRIDSVIIHMIIFKKKFNRNIEMIYKILDI